ncbi:MAG: LptA/OstA family protein [Candidatus Omnitrophica bacterium]|nr:LptA/OstA family protein [Candidatus Omnitrophota bacterium]
MKNFIYLIAMILLIATAGCSKRESVAQAAETAAPIAAGQPAAGAAAKTADPVKHQVMAFDLEGLADDGSKKWDVKGQSAESLTEDKVKLNNVIAGTYGKDAQATITADAGMYDKTKNNVRLEQNVKAVIENTKSGASNFMTLPASDKDAAVSKEVAAPDKAKKTRTTITCDAEVEFNYEKNEGYFNKNVHVVNDEGSIDSDKLTIYLDPASKTVKTIVAEGNVKIKRGENITYSDKATYIESEKKIVLTGQPKLVIYQEGGAGADIFKTSKKADGDIGT